MGRDVDFLPNLVGSTPVHPFPSLSSLPLHHLSHSTLSSLFPSPLSSPCLPSLIPLLSLNHSSDRGSPAGSGADPRLQWISMYFTLGNRRWWWRFSVVIKWDKCLQMTPCYSTKFRLKHLPKTSSGPVWDGPYRPQVWSSPDPRSVWKSTPLRMGQNINITCGVCPCVSMMSMLLMLLMPWLFIYSSQGVTCYLCTSTRSITQNDCENPTSSTRTCTGDVCATMQLQMSGLLTALYYYTLHIVSRHSVFSDKLLIIKLTSAEHK